MTKKKILSASIRLMLLIIVIAGCMSTVQAAFPPGTTGGAGMPKPPVGSPGSGMITPPGMMGPPGSYSGDGSMTPPDMTGKEGMKAPPGQQESDYTLSGVFTVDGEKKTESNKTYTSDTDDVSAIFVTNGGDLTLNNPTITTTGDTTSPDISSFYGLNGALLANEGSTVTVTGGSITTTGSGANGAIPTGKGTSIVLSDLTIKASGDGAHGVMATAGGFMTLTAVDITTTGKNGAPLATDRGSGTIDVIRGNFHSSGADSPGIYSTGAITVTDATINSEGSEAVVIEGINSVDLTNTVLSGGVEKTGGIMIYQSFSGDAETGTGTFTMEGGSYSSIAGPAFFVTNTDAVITLTGVAITSSSDTLIKATSTDRWGAKGENGGMVTFTADNEDLFGSLITDDISSVDATLRNGSTLTGEINSAALTLDSTSTWIVTGDSYLTSLVNPEGISESSITNIIGNGFTVTYDKDLTENSALGGKEYSLADGGTLIPE